MNRCVTPIKQVAIAVAMANIDSTKVTSKWYAITLLTAGHFFSDFYANFLPPLLPLLMSTLNFSMATAGLLVMTYSLTANILQPLCGYIIDRSGYGWLLLLTLPASAIFICYIGYTPNLTTVFLFVAVSGLASSLFHPLGSSLVGKIASPQTQGKAMSIFIGGGNFGFALAPVIITLCLVHYGITSLPWLIIPAILLSTAYYASKIHKTNLRSAHLSKTAGIPWYKSKDLLKLNGVMALRSWSQVAILTFLPVLLSQNNHSPTLAGSMLTVYLTGGALGGLAGGYIGDRFGHKKCIIGSLLLCLILMTAFLLNQDITLLTWVLLALTGAALQSTVPSSVIWAQNLLPGNAAMASGMMLGLSFGLGAAGTALTGGLADSIGLLPALFWTLLPLAVAIPLTSFTPYRGNPQSH